MEKARKRTKIDHNSSSDPNNNNTNTDDVIPMDLLNQILQRLPLKSIAKLVRVSKSWANLIRSNYFIKFFSLNQQSMESSHRLLLAFNELKDRSMKDHPLWANDNWSFFSSNDENKQKFISRMVVPQVKGRSCKPIYVNGLLNFMFSTRQVISNPSTGKSILLPLVKSRRKIEHRFFGFDPINGEYKVLCIIESRIRSYNNQVLTVRSKTESCLWRKLDSWFPHSPQSEGICIDGIIYYLAYEGLNPILVRFDVKSEKFLNQLPCLILQLPCLILEPFGRHLTLINYESKLAIAHQKSDYTFDVWVLEDVENVKWCKISQDVSILTSLCNGYLVRILGTIPSGEIAYTCRGKICGSFYVLYHDYKKNRLRSVEIKEGDHSLSLKSTGYIQLDGFIDFTESVMFL